VKGRIAEGEKCWGAASVAGITTLLLKDFLMLVMLSSRWHRDRVVWRCTKWLQAIPFGSVPPCTLPGGCCVGGGVVVGDSVLTGEFFSRRMPGRGLAGSGEELKIE